MLADQCRTCGAPKHAHGPQLQCDPDAVAYGDLLGARAVETPGTMAAPKTRLGLIIAIAGGLITIGAGISSCVNSALTYRQVRALERIADHVSPPPMSPPTPTYGLSSVSSTGMIGSPWMGELRRASSGQIEAKIDDAWLPTDLWVRDDGTVYVVVAGDRGGR